jgi:hemerythrin
VDRLLNIKNGRVPMTAEMSIFLHDWITHHILEQDLRAIHWCREHAEREPESH